MALNCRIGYIDLTRGESKTAPIPTEKRELFIGGRGLDIYFMYNHLREGVEPFSPDNVVVVGAGLLASTLASACARTNIMSKSPLTGHLGSTSTGGFFAPELRWAGFDHLVIKGRAAKPSYLFIHDGKIEIRDASSTWGKTVQDTQETLRQELRDERIQALCIGPAGEKLVRFANIVTLHQNAGGRTGIGAVMGSKNLKAIVARGKTGVDIEFPKEAIDYDKQLVRGICTTKFGRLMRRWGTLFFHELSDTKPGNINELQLDRLSHNHDNIDWESIDEYSFGMDGCFGCQLHCRHRYTIQDGPYSGVYAQGPGYESQEALGADAGCRNINTILLVNYLANSYGIDTVESGRLISWAMELYGRGILTGRDTGGLELEPGNEEAIIEMLHRIARREGLGDILAEGGTRAAQKIGKGSEKYLPTPHSDESATPSLVLAMATATNGSELSHCKSFIDFYKLPEPALRKLYSQPLPYDGPLSPDYRDCEGKAWQAVWQELCYMAADMIGLCKFHTVLMSPDMPGFKEFSKMVYLNTGLELSAEKIWECAERALTLERLLNLRESAAQGDSPLPDRYFPGSAPAGADSLWGKTLDWTRCKAMVDDYYRFHGWDENGVPRPETLERLGLDREPAHAL